MQFAKDSFYAALRERLQEVNPARTTVVDGIERPAIIVAENEASDISTLDSTFRLVWGLCASVGGGSHMMKVSCTIDYMTGGEDGTHGDRGRLLGTLDGELLAIAQPLRAVKQDLTRVPPASLGTQIFWTDLEFAQPKDEAGRLSRKATTTVYFTTEVKA
jgi:hypothetical protein